MAEVIGVVAAAIQIAQLSLKLIISLNDLATRLREARSNVQRRVQQLENLIAITVTISQNAQLQTPEVHSSLGRCLQGAESLKLVISKLLDNKKGFQRMVSLFGGAIMENRLAEAMRHLEEEKSTLLIAIIAIDCAALHRIPLQLSSIQREMEILSSDTTNELPQIRTAIESLTRLGETSLCSNRLSDERVRSCVASLNPTNQKFLVLQLLSRSKDAFSWFRHTSQYTDWIEESNTSVLVVTAGPGCGKSTLAAHISDWVSTETEAQSKKPLLLYFFFQSSSREVTRTASAAIRTLINQLIEQDPDLLPTVIRHFESLSRRGVFEWAWEDLWSLFLEIIEQVPSKRNIFLVVDATDECDDDSRKILLEHFAILFDNLRTRQQIENTMPMVKALITSRPNQQDLYRLSDCSSFEIQGFNTREDIDVLVSTRVSNLAKRRNFSTETTQRIKTFLNYNSRGMFLWVVLILEELEQRNERLTEATIISKLGSVPLTLTNTYEAILQRQRGPRMQEMWRIIRWLLYANRGLSLVDLETALVLESGPWPDFEGDLRMLCGSLIDLGTQPGKVALIHQTTREYLHGFVRKADPKDLCDINFEHSAAHTHMARICLQYLLCSKFMTDFETTLATRHLPLQYTRIIDDFLFRHPLATYSIENWSLHIQEAGNPDEDVSHLVQELLSTQTRRDIIMKLAYYMKGSKNIITPMGASPLHLAAYFNLPWLVDFYISYSSNSIDVDVECVSGDTPLIWAAETGMDAVVQKLLTVGANPNQREFDGWTALHWAARNGHERVAELLLENGARTGWVDGQGLSAQQWAARRGNWKVFDLIEDWNEKEENAESGGYDQSWLNYMQHHTHGRVVKGALDDDAQRMWREIWEDRRQGWKYPKVLSRRSSYPEFKHGHEESIP